MDVRVGNVICAVGIVILGLAVCYDRYRLSAHVFEGIVLITLGSMFIASETRDE